MFAGAGVGALGLLPPPHAITAPIAIAIASRFIGPPNLTGLSLRSVLDQLEDRAGRILRGDMGGIANDDRDIPAGPKMYTLHDVFVCHAIHLLKCRARKGDKSVSTVVGDVRPLWYAGVAR